jgi:hypothetical protein
MNERPIAHLLGSGSSQRRFLFGFPLRLVLAILRSSALLIDLYIPREAPFNDDLER